MRLDDEAAPQHRFQLRRRPEQFIEKPFLGFAESDAGRVAQQVQIERIAVEGQDGQLAGGAVEALPAAVHHDDPRDLLVIGEGAALGHDRDRLLRIATVVDQQAGNLAALVAPGDIDRQLARNRRERALLQQRRDEAVADLELQILERPVRCRQEIERRG